MTPSRKTTPTRVPRTRPTARQVVERVEAAKPAQAPPQPDFFAIPTKTLVDTIQLVGKIPAGQVGDLLIRLQQCQPLTITKAPARAAAKSATKTT